MSTVYEDGLHTISHDAGIYSSLPQYHAPERSPAAAPQVCPSNPSSAYASPSGVKGARKTEVSCETATSKKLFTMNRRIVIAVGMLILSIIIALIVGLGISLSRRNTGNTIYPTATSTAMSTISRVSTSTSSAVTSGRTGVAQVNCPSINNTVVTSGGSKFQALCAIHWPNNSAAINNNGTVSPVGSNSLWAYSLEQCLDFCVAYNTRLNTTVNPKENGSGCLVVTYNANLTNVVNDLGLLGNCFLKDREGVWDPARQTTESAILLST